MVIVNTTFFMAHAYKTIDDGICYYRTILSVTEGRLRCNKTSLSGGDIESDEMLEMNRVLVITRYKYLYVDWKSLLLCA